MAYSSELITSSQNKYVSLARSLSERKHRQKASLYRFDGVKLLCEAQNNGVELDFLLISESAYGALEDKMETLYSISLDGIECKKVIVSDSVFERISDENSPEGVIAVAKYDVEKHREIIADDISVGAGERVLLLESVRDPQNVGAILRTAAAFSVDRIVMSRDCADIYSAKTLRASMGAVFALKIDRVDAASRAISRIRECGRRVFAAALDDSAARLGETEFLRGDCVIIGNEGHGLSAETVKACDSSVYIPMSGCVESLNAAVAAAVIMWEFFGQNK